MNVFVLCTGRCGSVAFVQACRSITNFSAEHESRAGRVGCDRLAYPEQHIEADNRLSWYLGRLDERYGKDAYYVHLQRSLDEVARSYAKRNTAGIMHAFSDGILLPDTKNEDSHDPLQLATDICQTIDQNIRHFLRDKPHQMEVHLENITADFENFWTWIGAQGDLETAKLSLATKKNTSQDYAHRQKRNSLEPYSTLPLRAASKLGRVLKGLPGYLQDV